MVVAVSRVPHSALLRSELQSKKQHLSARQSIESVRKIQNNRYKSGIKNNGNLTSKDVKKYSLLSDDALVLLENASKKLDLSARRYFKTIKVARTIADLDSSKKIETVHISEALQYR